MNYINEIICADCLDALKKIPENTFQLIVTSPPYADSRKKTYGGIKPDEYVEWFLPRSAEMLRVLKANGTFILNIKEKVVNGERHTYVIDLIKALREQKWLWTEELMWHKKTSMPGKWPNRFRDAWERLLQFNKQKTFAMYQDDVMIPMGDWAISRLKKLGEADKRRRSSVTESGFGRKVENWVGKELVYPTNVLYLAPECGNKKHSAVFPYVLPEWFIKLFTKENDLVLDPFVGSGTTCIAAKNLKRQYTGIEMNKEYCDIANELIGDLEQQQ